MALLTEKEVRARAAQTTTLRKTATREILIEAASADAAFDVFLSSAIRRLSRR